MIDIDGPMLGISKIRLVLFALVSLAVLIAAGGLIGVPVAHHLAKSEIRHDAGYSYLGTISYSWPLVVRSDTPDTPNEAQTELREDGRLLGPPHQTHDNIRMAGSGRFSHWTNGVYFSASDNGDPRTNPRQYTAKLRLSLAPSVSAALVLLVLFVLGSIIYVQWRRKTKGSVSASRRVQFVLAFATGFLSAWGTAQAEGPAFWALLCAAVIATMWILQAMLEMAQELIEVRINLLRVREIALAIVSIGVTLMAVEAGLAWHEKAGTRAHVPIQDQSAAAQLVNESGLHGLLTSFAVSVPPELLSEVVWRQSLLTMPREWERHPVSVEGAFRAVRWHGVVHVYDEHGMRRTADFAPRRPDIFRVVVIGDSLTYGDGIEERYTYPAFLQRLMENDYSIEFLNLGSDGMQSDDIKRRLYEYVPRLQPDLVIYGVCHNDFLPSGVGQYSNKNEFAIPLPERLKLDLMGRSRLIRLASDGYNAFLLLVGLRADFYDDILKDFRNYQGRFAQDVKDMNSYVQSQGLPPIVSVVLDQKYPSVDPRPHEITRIAERHLISAGMNVIETDRYYRHFRDQDLTVSRWEGHPNEVANAIWASMIETHLRTRSELRSFERHRSS